MEELTARQIEILKAIIKEYTDTGEPVGSDVLEKKYKLGVSPATIRNEMVELAKKGYIKKTHFSSGRIPSAKGFRFYIQNLMKQKELSSLDEVSYKNSIWDERSDIHRLLSQATRVLAKKTGLLSVSTTTQGDLFYSGTANLLSLPEFLDLSFSRIFFNRLDEVTYWERILNEFNRLEEEILYYLGEEDFSDPQFEKCGGVFGEFEGEKIRGIIGVVGPKRMYYDLIIPQIRYFSNLIEQIIREQGL
ncbi:MAG: DeoR family transcriptional regulator [Microgenomates group bacterium]